MLWICLSFLSLVLGPVDAKTPGADSQGPELLKNPTFAADATGWILREATPEKTIRHGQSESVQLAGVETGPQSWSHAGVIVRPVPCDRELQFSCYVRGRTRDQSIMVNAFGYGDGRASTFQDSKSLTLRVDEWKQFTATYVVPAGSMELAIWIINSTAKPVIVSDAHLVLGKPKKAAEAKRTPKSLSGPGIVRATANAGVRTRKNGEKGMVIFPIPGTYRNQVPLTFSVKAEPPGALESYRCVDRPDGRNRLCEVTVAPTEKGAVVTWEALILLDRDDAVPLPRVSKPVVTDASKSWTRSTACVQSADPAIVAKAKALAEGADDVETLARKVMRFTSSNPGKPGVAFDALDARKALECGGSCTSRANLAAALLRASGVPARTVAHLPLWTPGLYEHWLVEYWHPGAGWVWLESTLGQFRPSTLSLVVLNVANPEDEDLAFDPIQLRQVMPGAPHWAVHTTSRELFPARGLKVPMNAASVEVAIVGEPGEMVALFAEARSAYARLAEESRSGKLNGLRADQLRAAMRTGKASDLTAALRGTQRRGSRNVTEPKDPGIGGRRLVSAANQHARYYGLASAPPGS
jgi:Transglutaminase-like superfamily